MTEITEITLIEMSAFLATPEAQALSTQAEKIAAAQAWKAALDELNTPVIPSYNPAEHLQRLKTERAQWGQAWRTWTTTEQQAHRETVIKQLDKQINEVSKLVTA